MSQALPYSNFKSSDNINVEGTAVCNGKIFEVDLEYPQHLHKSQNDYPLAPEKITVNEKWLSPYQTELLQNKSLLNVQKLIPNSMTKKDNVVHCKKLKLYKSFGMKVTKVYRVLEFDKKPWVAPNI